MAEKKPKKRPVLILHIGSNKTGTTALQTCMARNRKLMIQNKICYSNFDEQSSNHRNLLIGLVNEYLVKESTGLQPVIPWNLQKTDLQPPSAIIREMKHDLYKNNCEIAIISCEHFFHVPTWDLPCSFFAKHLQSQRNYAMKYLKETFDEFDIKVVCYLRRQDDYIESFFNQFSKYEEGNRLWNDPMHIKWGDSKYTVEERNAHNISLAKFMNGWMDAGYYANLSQWAAIFAKENIIVRPYEKSQIPNGIEYDFFTNILGLDGCFLNLENFDETPEHKANISFSKDIVEYKMATKLFSFNREFGILNARLSCVGENSKKNIVTAQQAEKILEYYKEDNEKIAREYLGRENGILFFDKPREEKDDYPGLSLQAAIDISRELVLILKKENHSLETELEAKQAELNNLLHSRSWKITEPLRAIQRILKHKKLRWITAPARKVLNILRK